MGLSRTRGWATIVAAFVVVGALLAGNAHAQDEASFQLGDRGWAELEPGGSLEISFHANQGERIDLLVKAWRGSDVRPVLELVDPSDEVVDLGDAVRTARKGNKVQLKKWFATATGLFRLSITDGGDGEGGGFDFTTKLKRTKAPKGTLPATRDDTPLEFVAHQGDQARLTVKTKRKGPSIRIAELVAPDGETRLGVAGRTDWIELTAAGDHAFVVAAEDDTEGTFQFKIQVKARTRTKERAELSPHVSRTSLRGRLVVPGHTEPSDREEAAKRPRRGPAGRQVLTGQLIVGDDVTAAVALDRLHAEFPGVRYRLVRSITDRGPHLIEVTGLRRLRGTKRNRARTRNLARALERIRELGFVDPNQRVQSVRTPNDSLWGGQSGMRQINAPKAWNTTVGDPGVVVAVIDSGIWPTHPDFAGRLLQGYDFVDDPDSSRDGDGWDSNPKDDARDFHGTHVAGIVAAAGNDRSGVTGVLWNGSILPVRGLGFDGGAIFDLIAALRWAVGLPVSGVPNNPNPADVVNMSYGAPGFLSSEAASIRDAHAAGAVLVAAAGNSGTTEIEYPAGYSQVISVAAIASDFRYSSYSNYGNSITLSAPGGDVSRGLGGILSTYVDEFTLQPTHRALDGTSMATPHVAGVAALLLSIEPDLTPDQVRAAMIQSALDLGDPGFDIDYGWGLVDAGALLELYTGPVPEPPQIVATPSALTLLPSAPTARIALGNVGGGELTVFSLTSETSDGANWLTTRLETTGSGNSVTVTADPAVAPPRTSRGTVLIRSSGGDLDVPVRLLRLQPPAVGNVVVSALDLEGETVATAVTDSEQGFEFELPGLPAGRYRIVAELDRNGDGELDQVSEWFGEYPVTGQSEPVEVDPADDIREIEFSLGRVDSSFDFQGAGGGAIRGAVATKVTDALTGEPIPGARLVIGDNEAVATTDEQGRAVAFGALFGAQDVTVAVDGYESQTRIDIDAQFVSFELEPELPQEIEVAVRLTALDSTHRSAFVQVGGEFVELEREANGVPLDATVTVPRTAGAIPIWCVTYTTDGTPLAFAESSIDGTSVPAATSVELEVESLTRDPHASAPVQVLLPGAPFDASSSALFAGVLRSFSARDSVFLAIEEVVPGVSRSFEWIAVPGDDDVPATLSLVAGDGDGRLSQAWVDGTTGDLPVPDTVQLPRPVRPSFPPHGGTTTPTTRLSWLRESPANVYVVEIENTNGPERWTLRVTGDQSQLVVPELPEGGLTPGFLYRWRVVGRLVGSYTHDDHRAEQFTIGTVNRATSTWQEFFVQ